MSNRKTQAKSPTGQTPLVEIPEEEKWRLIRESGLLERFNDTGKSPSTSSSTPTPPLTTDPEEHDGPSPLFEEIFNALMLIMPHTFFLIMMDILIHHQYAKQASFRDIMDRLINTFPIMALFMFYTIRHKNSTITQLGLLLLSFGVGPRMIWLVNRGSWLKNMAQCPQFATIWLYTVIQLKLSFALLSLVLIGGWSWWTGMKLL
ncbi:hypothetical protein EV363DRAFT_1314286 [Boletus edulis]|uniref:DUF7719 domain-containing protein n=1 Tax=Boletus edulis BED1 TaxID=1328754 RepID=A0AAD4C6Y6_BOLED|nr:hypothetical protein EV363DRAFT_1314286 [Boletus edulis]KAF8450422.1 hypothetical protein L210DRAFT_3520486 [Boletus edulis BED1]